jgi:glyoxylase-like metal-dependent hydrolase (beta-lactamase superfamily II)
MPMDFFIWVLIGGGRTILVDTGFDKSEGGKRGRELVLPVEDGLEVLGVRRDTVEHVIVTHMHWDHAGNRDLFPRARYHVQDREMSFCTGRCMCRPVMQRPFAVDDVTAMVRRVFAGKVGFHDGTGEVAPGVTVHLAGGHSRGLQVVRVNTRRGWVVLASDASHYYANLEQERPFPLLVDMQEMLEGFSLVRSLASSPAHIVPGHDPLVLARYPRSLPTLPHIARVDLPPTG